MKNKWMIFVLMGILAGCKMNMMAELYVSDLRETTAVANVNPNIKTSAQLAIQIPDSDECGKYTKSISEVMNGMGIEFQPKRCSGSGAVKDNMESYLLADIRIPLLNGGDAWDKSSSLFGILLNKDMNKILISLVMDKDKFEYANMKMSGEYHQKIKLSESRFQILLNNDERKTIKYGLLGVFLDGNPIIANDSLELKFRNKAEILLSNVGTTHLEKYGSVYFLEIEIEKREIKNE